MSSLTAEPIMPDYTAEYQESSTSYEVPPCEDIVLRSSDGTRFGAHIRNLEIYSDGFPMANSVVNSHEDVELSEDSDVVMLLLKFMHHQPQPDLSLLASKLLIKFANAAEKYGVYCATGVCKKHGYSSIMDKAGKLALTQEPARFFAYAHSIGDTTWRDLAELETHNIPTKEVFEALKQYPDWPPIFGAWYYKRELMREAIFDTLKNPIPVQHKGGQMRCADWYPFHIEVLSKMGTAVPSEKSFLQVLESSLPRLNGCGHCHIVVNSMKIRMSGLSVIARRALTSFLK
ncbi:hypothetical protein F5879DRAFT_621508 [Lentinula edodes]|nr:hypothetical protein F5879DRAFT_621508 [Lentinula edodes]